MVEKHRWARAPTKKKKKKTAAPGGADGKKSQHSVFFSSGRFQGSEPTLNRFSVALSLSPVPFFSFYSHGGMADQDTRRASAHVERDNSGFGLSGLSGGGSGVGVGGGAAGGSTIAERRRSTSFLPSGSIHGPEMLANDEDNELFMSDEFRMYCYKVRNRRFGFSSILVNGMFSARAMTSCSSVSLPRPGCSHRTRQSSDPSTGERVRPAAAPERVSEEGRREQRRAGRRAASVAKFVVALFFSVGPLNPLLFFWRSKKLRPKRYLASAFLFFFKIFSTRYLLPLFSTRLSLGLLSEPRSHTQKPKKTPKKIGALSRKQVLACSKRFVHDWTSCPFAHAGEKARRRDPRDPRVRYTGIACPDMKAGGGCARGELCPYAHNVFEYWLHPTR